jgi:hypothetical protein
VALPLGVGLGFAQLAEFIEAAHRVGGAHAATALARKPADKHFDPALAGPLCVHAEGSSAASTWFWRGRPPAGSSCRARRVLLLRPAAGPGPGRRRRLPVNASPGRTDRPDHVQRIYAKIDASNRATAAMFAVRRGLLPEKTTIITAAL